MNHEQSLVFNVKDQSAFSFLQEHSLVASVNGRRFNEENVSAYSLMKNELYLKKSPHSMKIYVASSWRNIYQPRVVEILKELGHEVYDFRNPAPDNKGFAWSSIDIDWENWTTKDYLEALNHPVAEKGFNLDFDAMKWADACVMILPCGRSANTEAGWMKGAGKKVYVYSPIKQEPELMYKIHDDIFASERELVSEFLIF